MMSGDGSIGEERIPPRGPYWESWVKSEDAARLVELFYAGCLCEGCEACPPRVTVEGWRGIKKKAIVFAKPSKLEEFRAAARHKRVDGISFGKGTLRYLDDSQAKLMIQFGKIAEVRIREVVKHYKSLGDLRDVLNLALNKELPLTFTCAPSEPLEVCHPFQIISLCESLGFEEEDVKALWGLSSNFLRSLIEAKLGMRKVLRGER
jgi:RNase P/RNase MRP subunit p30